jgi:hypothetical protein
VKNLSVNFRHQNLQEPMPELAEMFPNWLNFAQIDAQKSNHGSNFSQIKIKLRAFDSFLTNFGHFGGNKITVCDESSSLFWPAVKANEPNKKHLKSPVRFQF